MQGQRLLRGTALGLALASPAVAATEIYKWVTADGVTHYSESAPASGAPAVETVELVDVGPPAQTAPGYDAVLEVAKEIEAGRLERERLRLERDKLRQEQALAAAREQHQDFQGTSYYPVFPYYHHYPGNHPRPPMHLRRGPKQPPVTHLPEDYRPAGAVNARVPGMTNR